PGARRGHDVVARARLRLVKAAGARAAGDDGVALLLGDELEEVAVRQEEARGAVGGERRAEAALAGGVAVVEDGHVAVRRRELGEVPGGAAALPAHEAREAGEHVAHARAPVTLEAAPHATRGGGIAA